MKTELLSICLLCLALGANTVLASSKSSRPSCDEEPGLRDCVKVEDPDAKPPKPNVNRKKQPAGPAVKPLPATGGAKV